MTEHDVQRAVQHARNMILAKYPGAVAADHSQASKHSVNEVEHALYMLCRIEAFMSENRSEKAMRWLGFVQGWLWSWGFCTIEEMKEANKPEEAEIV